MRSNIDPQYTLKSPLRVGTLFSGIGAFEEALKQLDIPHEIKFACDNGEIELIPLDDPDIPYVFTNNENIVGKYSS